MGREDEIRLIAYNIWEQEGSVNDRDHEYWYRAEAIWEQQQNEQPVVKSAVKRTRKTAERKTSSTATKKPKKA